MLRPSEEIQQQFELLRQTYQQQLPSKIEQIEAVWLQIQRNALNKANWEIFYCLAHRLVGSSATFGFHGLSETAHTLEGYIKDLVETSAALTEEQQTLINALVETLKLAVNNPHLEALNYTRQELIHPDLARGQSRTDNTVVFLVEDDLELAKDLAGQLGFFGYDVRIFADIERLMQAIALTPPAAAIVDIMLPEGPSAGVEAITKIQHSLNTTLPILFISARDDLSTRLQAVRAGGMAYFTKPIDIGSLIDKLDTLTLQEEPEPARILIVEDESILATYYAMLLQQAGMLATVVTDPMQIMAPLVDFKPDLILMDMYMPGCSGLELASVIRQQDAYVSIPIVFLSVETNVEQQLAAMHLGGDEFLTKPIDPSHLIAEVKSRVDRSRILSAFMVKDSLTGLLNHTKLKEQLYLEVARAKRHQTPLAFAMLDIDHFKSINDAFGHLIGDRVIRSLARMLQQRLRKTDIIGRYGGEEFAMIFPHTTVENAARILDELRVGFAKVRQQANEHEFSVTFSCGVAAFPDYKDPNSLNEAADQMLYHAKRNGRNQVAIAFPPRAD